MPKQSLLLLRWADDFAGLFYPHLCLACAERKPPRRDLLCISCRTKLPHTDYHEHQENALTERFWGRAPIYSGAAMFNFIKGGKTQHLLHQLKYQGKQQVGVLLGEWYGQELKKSIWFQSVEAIVPVPLHPRKERQRGFNQSDTFARGLARTMGVPWYKNGLRRKTYTQTQTQKGRMERFGNVESVFEVGEPAKLKDKHILLVDDVITTGATLEACTHTLLQLPGVKVSLASIAIAGS